MKTWTLFPEAVSVVAEDEETAKAKAKTEIQRRLLQNEFEFEDIVEEGDISQEIDENEILKIDASHKERIDDNDF